MTWSPEECETYWPVDPFLPHRGRARSPPPNWAVSTGPTVT